MKHSFERQTGGVNADSVECGISGKYEKLPCKREVAASHQTKEWEAVFCHAICWEVTEKDRQI